MTAWVRSMLKLCHHGRLQTCRHVTAKFPKSGLGCPNLQGCLLPFLQPHAPLLTRRPSPACLLLP
jgi:hypothetical protein